MTAIISFITQRPWIVAIAALALLLTFQTVRLSDERLSHAKDNDAHAKQITAIEAQAVKDIASAKAEGERRYETQSKIVDDANTKRLAAETALATANAHGNQLRNDANLLAKQLRAATANTATAELRASASTATGVLTDVFGGMEQAGRTMASEATKRGIAGESCQRQYDSLSAR